jgi:hypothetical protein
MGSPVIIGLLWIENRQAFETYGQHHLHNVQMGVNLVPVRVIINGMLSKAHLSVLLSGSPHVP